MKTKKKEKKEKKETTPSLPGPGQMKECLRWCGEIIRAVETRFPSDFGRGCVVVTSAMIAVGAADEQRVANGDIRNCRRSEKSHARHAT